MQTYSEFFGAGRKATVTLLESHWDRKFNKWEVAMYVDDKVIERRIFSEEYKAEEFAEDFVGGGDGEKVLLNG
jgi:hypothetical protein